MTLLRHIDDEELCEICGKRKAVEDGLCAICEDQELDQQFEDRDRQ